MFAQQNSLDGRSCSLSTRVMERREGLAGERHVANQRILSMTLHKSVLNALSVVFERVPPRDPDIDGISDVKITTF